jgi:tRNA pseudouridine synthase 10
MGDKTYRMIVKFNKPVKKQELKKLKSLIGTISQRTPIRVAHRRADLIRRRLVKDLRYRRINGKTIVLTIKGSSGLYVKELVHGDEGRTKPSLVEVLNVEAVPKNLDVIKIERPKNL